MADLVDKYYNQLLTPVPPAPRNTGLGGSYTNTGPAIRPGSLVGEAGQGATDLWNVAFPDSQLPADAPILSKIVEGGKNAITMPGRVAQHGWGLLGSDGPLPYNPTIGEVTSSVGDQVMYGITGQQPTPEQPQGPLTPEQMAQLPAGPTAPAPAPVEAQAVTSDEVAQSQQKTTEAVTEATAQSPAAIAKSAGMTKNDGSNLNWYDTINKTFDLQTIGMNMLANSDSGMSTLANLGKSAVAAQNQMRAQNNVDSARALKERELEQAAAIAQARLAASAAEAEARNQAMLEVAGIQAGGRVSAANALAQQKAAAQGMSDSDRVGRRNIVQSYGDFDTEDARTTQNIDSLIDNTQSVLRQLNATRGFQGPVPQTQLDAALNNIMKSKGTVDEPFFWGNDELTQMTPEAIQQILFGTNE